MCMEGSLEEMIKRYIVTSAEYGAGVNHKQLDAYEQYASQWDADIIVVPIEGQHKDEPMHPRIAQYTNADEMSLNDNLSIEDFGVKAQTINPLTGLKRFGKSTIVGSPKMHLEHVANSPKISAHAVMSTGSCTTPNYKQNRIGRIGNRDHQQGAILVEVEDNKTFHFRQAVHNVDGSFIDMGIKYSAKGPSKDVSIPALVMADLHDHQKDIAAYDATLGFLDEYDVKNVVGHDIFDAYSISHHDAKSAMTLARKAKGDELNLRQELYNLGQTVEEIASRTGTFYAVKSNHDEHLTRWLEEGRFMQEPHNLELGLKLASALIEGKDPVEEGIKLTYGSVPSNMKFLQRDDELRIKGVECAFHGDKGPRGGRGSPIGLEYSLRDATVAHMHHAFIRKGLWGVGSLALNQAYTKGSMGCGTITHNLINNNGKRQHINYTNGKFTV